MNHKMKVRGRQRIFRFLDPLSFGSSISNQVLVWGAYAFSIVNSMLWGVPSQFSSKSDENIVCNDILFVCKALNLIFRKKNFSHQ